VEARGIPDEYQCHHKVFSDQQATHFPPSRPEDHAIKLIPGALETINCKVYPLTLAEQEATKKFLEENEQLGCYDLQRGHMTSGWNGLGHVISIQIG
jgi:hypothetical protein